jgi:hypothetical protein
MMPRIALILCASLIVLCGLPSDLLAQQKTVRECRAEWQAQRAEYQAKGVTEAAYIKQCRSGGQESSAPTPTPGAAAPGATTAPPARTSSTPAARGGTPGANQFASEAQAKGHCATDTVVWANLSSKVYHFSGYRDYGNTKRGAYMCEGDATQQGFRAAKNEKHPS